MRAPTTKNPQPQLEKLVELRPFEVGGVGKTALKSTLFFVFKEGIIKNHQNPEIHVFPLRATVFHLWSCITGSREIDRVRKKMENKYKKMKFQTSF